LRGKAREVANQKEARFGHVITSQFGSLTCRYSIWCWRFEV
jgi:hypothetical protein